MFENYTDKDVREIQEALYRADLDGRKEIIEQFRKMDWRKLLELPKPEVLFLCKIFGFGYGYICGEPMIDRYISQNCFTKISYNPSATHQDIVEAQIQLANLYRFADLAKASKALLAKLEPKLENVSSEVKGNFYWVRAASCIDDLDNYSEYTQKAMDEYEKIPYEERSIIVKDRMLCLKVWQGFQLERMAYLLRLTGTTDEDTGVFFNLSRSIFIDAITECEREGIKRAVDAYLHLAVLSAYIDEDYETAELYLEKAKEFNAQYFPFFEKLVNLRCLIGRSQEPEELSEFSLNTYKQEADAWGWAKGALVIKLKELLEEKYKKQPDVLKERLAKIS